MRLSAHAVGLERDDVEHGAICRKKHVEGCSEVLFFNLGRRQAANVETAKDRSDDGPTDTRSETKIHVILATKKTYV